MGEEILIDDGGVRLDRFLAQRYSGYSRSHLKDLIQRGCVHVNGRPGSADHILKSGERIVIQWPECRWMDVPFEEWILYEDPEMLVLRKPPGLLMHPVGPSWLKTPGAALSESEPNLAGILLRHRPQIKRSDVSRCGLVHRLDRETSGVLVVAKTRLAQEQLIQAFAERRVEKVYRGIVAGVIERSIDVEAPLGRDPKGRKIKVTQWGKEAATSFRVVERGRGATLVEARPLTGRTHQIRAHLGHIRHPVLGDPEWGQTDAADLKALGLPPPPRLLLHAYRLTVPHPKSGKPMHFTAPVPKDFRDYWNQVKL